MLMLYEINEYRYFCTVGQRQPPFQPNLRSIRSTVSAQLRSNGQTDRTTITLTALAHYQVVKIPDATERQGT